MLCPNLHPFYLDLFTDIMEIFDAFLDTTYKFCFIFIQMFKFLYFCVFVFVYVFICSVQAECHDLFFSFVSVVVISKTIEKIC